MASPGYSSHHPRPDTSTPTTPYNSDIIEASSMNEQQQQLRKFDFRVPSLRSTATRRRRSRADSASSGPFSLDYSPPRGRTLSDSHTATFLSPQVMIHNALISDKHEGDDINGRGIASYSSQRELSKRAGNTGTALTRPTVFPLIASTSNPCRSQQPDAILPPNFSKAPASQLIHNKIFYIPAPPLLHSHSKFHEGNRCDLPRQFSDTSLSSDNDNFPENSIEFGMFEGDFNS